MFDIVSIIQTYGYLGIFLLMLLESASLPIPSEIVLPSIGFLSKSGIINPFVSYIVSVIGSFFGIMIDYYIGFFLNKEFVYRHAMRFKIKKEHLDMVYRFFEREGEPTVLISRFVPVIRGLISFPAGFAKMNVIRFSVFSLIGILLYNALLIAFGYYALSLNLFNTIIFVAIFLIILYLVFVYFIKRIKNKINY